MGLFSALREKREAIEAEQRQVGYEKDSTIRQQEYRPESEQTVHGLIEGRSDLQRWQQQLKEDFDTIIDQLGYVERHDGKIERKKDSIIICNEKCISFIKSIMMPFYFRSVSITKLDKVQINTMLLVTLQKMLINISVYSQEFGIGNVADANTIVLMVENVIQPILFRSIDGFTKKEDSGARKIIEDATGRVQEKQSLFGRMIGMT